MKFLIKSPCEGCPFRSDVHGFLRRDRAADIAETLGDDHQWFACHMTTPQGTGRRVKNADQSVCMGSMRVLWKAGLPNIAMRIALLAGLLKRSDLEKNTPPTFDSLEAFTEHHGK